MCQILYWQENPLRVTVINMVIQGMILVVSYVHEIIAIMHSISSDNVMGQVQLGPTLTALIEVEREIIKALLDTGSPVAIT